MANYVVAPELLLPYVPAHTELDLWNGRCYVSLVGFMFVNTRMLGIKVPFHVNFEEVNLRFYVRYNEAGEWRRGVVFIKEIVPKPMLSLVANTLYHENYETMPMRHSWEQQQGELHVKYSWQKKRWHHLQVTADAMASDIAAGSEAEFITEHYWGYTKVGRTRTLEYRVEHPRWQVHEVKAFTVEVDFKAVYGEPFGYLSQLEPRSVFLAAGSEIVVNTTRKIS